MENDVQRYAAGSSDEEDEEGGGGRGRAAGFAGGRPRGGSGGGDDQDGGSSLGGGRGGGGGSASTPPEDMDLSNIIDSSVELTVRGGAWRRRGWPVGVSFPGMAVPTCPHVRQWWGG